jgi:hypothetical protein
MFPMPGSDVAQGTLLLLLLMLFEKSIFEQDQEHE